MWRAYISIDGETHRYANAVKIKAVVWRKIMEQLYNADRRTA
jgi:hypothetical protein